MKDEIREGVEFLRQFITKYGQLKGPQQVDAFAQRLASVLHERYVNHWYESMPMKGQAFRCLRVKKSENYVDPVLEGLLKHFRLNLGQLGLPNDFTLWIDPGEVTCRFGERLTYTIARVNKDAPQSQTPQPQAPPTIQTPTSVTVFSEPAKPAAAETKKSPESPSLVVVDKPEKIFDEKLTEFIRLNSTQDEPVDQALSEHHLAGMSSSPLDPAAAEVIIVAEENNEDEEDEEEEEEEEESAETNVTTEAEKESDEVDLINSCFSSSLLPTSNSALFNTIPAPVVSSPPMSSPPGFGGPLSPPIMINASSTNHFLPLEKRAITPPQHNSPIAESLLLNAINALNGGGGGKPKTSSSNIAIGGGKNSSNRIRQSSGMSFNDSSYFSSSSSSCSSSPPPPTEASTAAVWATATPAKAIATSRQQQQAAELMMSSSFGFGGGDTGIFGGLVDFKTQQSELLDSMSTTPSSASYYVPLSMAAKNSSPNPASLFDISAPAFIPQQQKPQQQQQSTLFTSSSYTPPSTLYNAAPGAAAPRLFVNGQAPKQPRQQPQQARKESSPVVEAPKEDKTAGGESKSYCGYVESFPYYYKLNRLYNALALQKLQTERMRKSTPPTGLMVPGTSPTTTNTNTATVTQPPSSTSPAPPTSAAVMAAMGTSPPMTAQQQQHIQMLLRTLAAQQQQQPHQQQQLSTSPRSQLISSSPSGGQGGHRRRSNSRNHQPHHDKRPTTPFSSTPSQQQHAATSLQSTTHMLQQNQQQQLLLATQLQQQLQQLSLHEQQLLLLLQQQQKQHHTNPQQQ